MKPAPTPIPMTPIGVVRSSFVDKFSTPRQPFAMAETVATIELAAGHNFEAALCDLATFSHIWVLFVFHKNSTWHPKVMPPMGSTVKRGVFSTRAPHRPNPIGMSVVRLIAISGRTLQVMGLDALDGTPVLDLKPYVPVADAVAGASSGWLPDDEPAVPAYDVNFSDYAAAQIAWWMQATGEELRARIVQALTHGPAPLDERPIRGGPDGHHILGLPSWRIAFRIEKHRVMVSSLHSAHTAEHFAADPSLTQHRAFTLQFPEGLDGTNVER